MIRTNLRKIWLPTAIVATLSLAEILFASPLFALLGFEYSTLMALALSLICGLQSPVWTGFQPGRPIDRTAIKSILLSTLFLATLPLALSLLSLVWLPNCSLWDGIVFYFEIAYPSALIGCAFGIAFAMRIKNRRFARVSYIVFWVVTLILSLQPGYTNPQLFTYGWQYGFFPGFVWDEAMELTNTYLFSRLEQVSWLVLVFSILFILRGKRSWPVAIPALLVTVMFSIAHDDLGITRSSSAVRKSLGTEVSVAKGVTIVSSRGSITADALELIRRDVRWYLYDIRKRFELTDTTHPITIFLYPSTDDLFDQIGTRSASIAKPWLGQVHITMSNLGSLKHELSHVLLREFGVWPFYASFSTGLTEGAAMSVEPKYDGLYTLDEHAARILQLHYAEGVQSVMAFTGFASNASQKSYVLAGSFSRYLLKQYGPKPFEKVYRSLSFVGAYGKPIDTLESEWKHSLGQYMTPLDPNDSLRLRYYYDRMSIINQPCIRRIGKLERRASRAWKSKDYESAKFNYSEAAKAGGGLSPLFGLSEVLFQQDSLPASLAVLDTPRTLDAIKQKPAMYIREGDLELILGDSARAINAYDHAMQIRLSSANFLSAYIHRTIALSDVCDLFAQYLRCAYRRDDSGNRRTQILDSLVNVMDTTHDPTFQQVYGRYLNGHQLRVELDKWLDAQMGGTAERRYGRVGEILMYLKYLKWLKDEGGDMASRFAGDIDYIHKMTEPDSLAFYLMSVNLEQAPHKTKLYLVKGTTTLAPAPFPDNEPLNELADQWCPARYRNAARELRDEIDEQFKFETASDSIKAQR